MQVNNMTKLRPDYYKGENGKDLFDVFEEEFPREWTTGFYVLNLVKYVRRYKGKNGVEDLKKARTYLDRLIEFEEKPTSCDEVPNKNWSKSLAEKQREVFGDSVDKQCLQFSKSNVHLDKWAKVVHLLNGTYTTCEKHSNRVQ